MAPFVLPLIGAGMSALGNLFNKPAKTTSSIDPELQKYLAFYRQQAMHAAGAPSEQFTQALGNYGDMAKMGMDASHTMSDPAAFAAAMNDSASDPFWAMLQNKGLGAIGQQATEAKAFGGSRQGVAEGSMLANLGIGRQQSAFAQLMARLSPLMQQGYNATGAMGGMDWDARNMAILQGAAGGPYGTTTSTSGGGNPVAGALGGAMFGMGLNNPSTKALNTGGPWPGMNPNWMPAKPASWPTFGTAPTASAWPTFGR